MHDPAETERQVGDEVERRDHLEHRQLSNRRQRVRHQSESRGPGPGALQDNVLKIVLDQLERITLSKSAFGG